MVNILIVEDYPSIQQVYQTALGQEGYAVTVAGDGQEALKIAAATQPDIILLDLLMPNMGGLEFLRLYNATKHAKAEIIVFSNLSSPELSSEAIALGAGHYLSKSEFTPRELLAVVKKILAKTS